MYAYKMVQIPPNIQVAAKKMFGKAPDITEIAPIVAKKSRFERPYYK